MRIAWVVNQTAVIGGGQRSDETIAEELRRRGHTVVFYGLEARMGRRGLPHSIRRAMAARRLLSDINIEPDIYFADGVPTPWVMERAGRAEIPAVAFVRDHYWTCLYALHRTCDGRCFQCYGLANKAEWPWLRREMAARRRALDQADAVVTNSEFMQEMLRVRGSIESSVVYPPVGSLAVGFYPPDPIRVAYLGQGGWKGSRMIRDLARLNPRYEFVVAGRQDGLTRRMFEGRENVRLIGWRSPRVALSGANVVLVPSEWQEPFGRVPVEAGTLRIPTIASLSGGLPEAVGPGGILVPPGDVELWNVNLRSVMDNPSLREGLADEAVAHSLEFRPTVQVDRLERALGGMLDA